MGQEQAGVENALDIDVVEAGGLGLEKLDPGGCGFGEQIGGDIAAEIDDRVDPGKLRSRWLVAVEDAQREVRADGGDDVFAPGLGETAYRVWQKEYVEVAQ